MAVIEQVSVEPMEPRRFGRVLSEGEYEALVDLITHATRALHGRVIWNVNSTAKGGGVVEMLRPLLGYSRGAGVDARWAVISGDPEFFAQHLGRYFEVISHLLAARAHEPAPAPRQPEAEPAP